jgi:hypothetical protein
MIHDPLEVARWKEERAIGCGSATIACYTLSMTKNAVF